MEFAEWGHKNIDGGWSLRRGDIGNGGRGGQCNGPSQRIYFAKPSAETSAECSRWLTTMSKRKQRSQSTVEAKRARREQNPGAWCGGRHHMHAYS